MTPPGYPRRILMTTDTVGGVWHYAIELCRGLRQHGVGVTLATMGPRPGADQKRAAAALDHVTLCESAYRLEWMDTPWHDIDRAGAWLLDLEARFAPDLIHLNGYVHAALPWRAPTLVVAHSCVLSWWRAVRGGDAPAEWNVYRDHVARGLASATRIVAPTQAMLDALHAHYAQETVGAALRRDRADAWHSPESLAGMASRHKAAPTLRGALRDKSRVIPNGRDAAQFSRPSAKQPFILSVGRLWDEAKNAAALAATAPQLSWPITVAGDLAAPDGSTRPWANLHALGRCPPEQLAELYARAAIYALPARYEPFGLSVLEAALAGCALVLGDIPSLRELWQDAAAFVAPNDTDALRNALAALIAGPEQRHRMAARARVRAQRYTAQRMVSRYLESYRELLTFSGRVRRPDEPSFENDYRPARRSDPALAPSCSPIPLPTHSV